MIPNVAQRGTSFKGVGSYLLHDKADEDGQHAKTSERVGWSETRNVCTDDPEFALRVMAATAMDKDRLKEAAGVRKSGRKSSNKDVYHYSLAWSDDEAGRIDKAEMLRAVDMSLKALGAEKFQAAIIAHTDEDHPHVHVVVNLVNPETGRNLDLHHDRDKLDRFAYEYRKERGEDHIYCVDRSRKFEALDERKRGKDVEVPKPKRSRNRPRNKTEEQLDKIDPKAREIWEKEQRAMNKDLGDYGRQMHARHKNQWEALERDYRDLKAQDRKAARGGRQGVIDGVKEEFSPQFSAMYRRHWGERQAFEQRETRLLGKVQNMLDAINHAQVVRGEVENQNALTKLQNFVKDAGNRKAWLNARQHNEMRALRGEQRQAINLALWQNRLVQDIRSKSRRRTYQDARGELARNHEAERNDLKRRWQSRNAARRSSMERLITRHGLEVDRDTRSHKRENATERKAPRKPFVEASKTSYDRPAPDVEKLDPVHARQASEEELARWAPKEHTGGQEEKEEAGRQKAGAEYRNKQRRSGAEFRARNRSRSRSRGRSPK